MESKPARSVSLPTRPIAFGCGLSPLWLLLFLTVVSIGFLGPLGDKAAGIDGIPLGWFLLGLIALLTAVGFILIVRATSSIGLILPLVFLIFPALMLVIIGPAIVLIVENVVP